MTRPKKHKNSPAEQEKNQYDEYGTDLSKIIDGNTRVVKNRGKVFEGTEGDPTLAPHARAY